MAESAVRQAIEDTDGPGADGDGGLLSAIEQAADETFPETPDGEAEVQVADTEPVAADETPAPVVQAQAPPADPEVSALQTQIAADPILAAKLELANRYHAAGKADKAQAIFDDIAADLGVEPAPDAPEPTAQVIDAPPLAQAALAEQITDENIKWRSIENRLDKDLGRAQQSYQTVHAECERLAREYDEVVREEGDTSRAAKLISQNWNQLNTARQQQQGFIATTTQERDWMKHAVAKNIQDIPELAPIKTQYLKAAYQGHVDIDAPKAVQLQQLAKAGIRLPVARPAAPKVSRETMAKLRGINTIKSVGVRPAAAATGQARRPAASVAGKLSAQDTEFARRYGFEV